MNAKKLKSDKNATRLHNREATESHLLIAAAAIFSKKGYETATTREIADEAGCSEALIHRYFGGKNGLLVAVVRSGQGKTPMADISSRPYPEMIQEEVRHLFEATAENLKGRSEHIRITFSRALIDPSFDDFKKIVSRPERLAAVEQRLRHYQERGQIRRDVDLAGATEMLLGLIFQLSFVHREIMGISNEEYESKAMSFCEIFVRGII